MTVNTDPFPTKLRKVVDELDDAMGAIGYIPDADFTYQGGSVKLVTWNDPTGHHIAFRDSRGWYSYEALHG